MKQWTFHSLCDQLESSHDLSDNAEGLNTLIGAISSLIGEPTTEGLAGFIGTLAEKDKLISLCASILQAILSRKSEDYSGRVDQMREAYGILCFTAFFDELDSLKYSFDYPSDDLPELLRVCLQMGCFQEVKYFFANLCPGGFIKVVLQSVQDWKAPGHRNADIWISRFLLAYKEMFEFNMEDAVYLLYLIFKRGPTPKEFKVAYIYSLLYYQSVLEKSVKGAARLLTMFEEMYQ
ncbi:MAG: hypothetical protein HDT15_03970 [Oscillibacter sp.]|nr:hypothetical protein [Oscillibacter sp.]